MELPLRLQLLQRKKYLTMRIPDWTPALKPQPQDLVDAILKRRGGALITVKALYELERVKGRYALVTMCIGGGQGIAAIFERM